MAKPVLSTSGTNYPLHPWVNWYFQYDLSLPEEERKNKEQTLLDYVKQYFSLITSKVGGYEAYSNHEVVSGGFVIGAKLEHIHEYHFTASLQLKKNKIEKADPFPQVSVLVNGVPRWADPQPGPSLPEPNIKLAIPGGGTAAAATSGTGSGSSGTPPPPPKPGG
jgi:hypothetical protein